MNVLRRMHRWVSVAFTLAFLANLVAMAFGPPPAVITYSPLVPLFILLPTGVALFLAPYLSRKQS